MAKPKRSTILKEARSQLGVTESPRGSNKQKYGKWYGWNGVPWCAQFVSWLFRSNLDAIHGKAASTVVMAKRFYDAKKWTTKPKAGYVVFFHFGNPKFGGRWKGIHHVGIVESVRPDGRIVTIEGNTGAGNDANGGAVMRRVRSQAMVAGYGVVDYAPETVAPKPKPKPKPTVNPARPVLQMGSTGDAVLRVQRILGVFPDGVFGKETHNAVYAFQTRQKLERDGVVGPETWTALLKVRK